MMNNFRFWVFAGVNVSMERSVEGTTSFVAESGSPEGMGGGFWEVDLEIFFLLGTQPPPFPIVLYQLNLGILLGF